MKEKPKKTSAGAATVEAGDSFATPDGSMIFDAESILRSSEAKEYFALVRELLRRQCEVPVLPSGKRKPPTIE